MIKNLSYLTLVLFIGLWTMSGIAPMEKPVETLAPTEDVIPLRYDLFQILIRVCADTGVPLDTGLGLVLCESNGNPNAVHHDTNGTMDWGLVQHNTRYHTWFAQKYNGGYDFDPCDPTINLRVGLSYLADLHRQFGTWTKAVAAYNCGSGNVARGTVPTCTVAYTVKVLNGGVVALETSNHGLVASSQVGNSCQSVQSAKVI